MCLDKRSKSENACRSLAQGMLPLELARAQLAAVMFEAQPVPRVRLLSFTATSTRFNEASALPMEMGKKGDASGPLSHIQVQ